MRITGLYIEDKRYIENVISVNTQYLPDTSIHLTQPQIVRNLYQIQ